MHRGVTNHDAGVRDTQLILDLRSDAQALFNQKAAAYDFACEQTHGAEAPELVGNPDPIA